MRVSIKKYFYILLLACLSISYTHSAIAKARKITMQAEEVFNDSQNRSEAAQGRPVRHGEAGRGGGGRGGASNHCPINSECWKELIRSTQDTADKHLGPNSPIGRYDPAKAAAGVK